MSIKELTDRIIEDGVITREEYHEFMENIDEDGITDAEEEAQIKRILKMIQRGELKILPPKTIK